MDVKIAEVERYMALHGCQQIFAIDEVLGIRVTPASNEAGTNP